MSRHHRAHTRNDAQATGSLKTHLLQEHGQSCCDLSLKWRMKHISCCSISVISVLVTFLVDEMTPCFLLLDLWDLMVKNWAKYYWISWQNTVGNIINFMLIAWEHIYLQKYLFKMVKWLSIIFSDQWVINVHCLVMIFTVNLLRIFIHFYVTVIILPVSGCSLLKLWIVRFQSWLHKIKLHFCEIYHKPYHFKNLFMSQKFNCVKFMTLNTLTLLINHALS